jgi:hypothetical protein
MSNEKKYTREEIRAIIDEELRKANLNPDRELSADEMEQVSGGHYTRVFKSHEEIDQVMDIISSVWDKYGRDVAVIAAFDMKVTSSDSRTTVLDRFTHPEGLRIWLHQELNGEHDSLIQHYANT